MNNGSKRAVVFDADTDTVLGSVGVGSSSAGDCSVTGNQKLGFGTAFDNRVYPIDLDTLTPAGPPIPIANPGEDTSLTPDEKFMAVCDGSATRPVSVIDVGTQTQISTFNLGHDCNSVEVCSDGSVLVSSFTADRVRRLTIDGAGQLSDTGEVLNVTNPMNVVCGAGAASGVAIALSPGRLQSFTMPGLAPVHTRNLGGDGMSLEINNAGDRVYARKNSPGAIHVFDYDSATGALSAAPLLWPPNHKMVDVKVDYATSDACSGAVTTSLSVSSNEPVDGSGDGDTSPDWVVINNHSVKLRAERAGTGTGRVYTITVTATDAAGNSSTESITVVVPHNQ